MNNSIIISNMNSLAIKNVNLHNPYEYNKYQVASKDNGKCNVAFYEVPIGKSNYPYHYHTNNTEVFYIIKGSGIIKTPEGDKIISAGDVVVCPLSNESAHKITNTSKSETLIYLDVSTNNSPDIVFLSRFKQDWHANRR